MAKIWAGRASGEMDAAADDFNSSIRFDSRMFREDIKGSIAHSAMLGAQGIIPADDAAAIRAGLEAILSDIESGVLPIDYAAEDIHSFVEAELTRRIGDAGKRLHTARSRNDQVALDLRMHLREECAEIRTELDKLIRALCSKAEENAAAVMPGYTHLQRAQPVTFGHHLMAYAMMFLRDVGRIDDTVKRMNVSPIGACALAGTTYPTDRTAEAAALGFDGVMMNSMDAVADRDFCVELLSSLSLIMAHLSRLSEELVLWSSWEFRFVELSDAYTTGSSIMPQKKNPDMAELARGKTGRVYGDLMAMLTVLKGLPLAYNKDMQEDKEAVFDGVDTVKACLGIFPAMIATMNVRADNMRKAAAEGFINATDLADWLTAKNVPFRTAYKISGQIVAECQTLGCTLETLPLENYKAHDELFDETIYDAVDIDKCVLRRTSLGGPTEASVREQVKYVTAILDK